MAGNLLACPRPYKSKFALDDSEVVVCKYLYLFDEDCSQEMWWCGGHMKQFAVGLLLIDKTFFQSVD